MMQAVLPFVHIVMLQCLNQVALAWYLVTSVTVGHRDSAQGPTGSVDPSRGTQGSVGGVSDRASFKLQTAVHTPGAAMC